MKGVEIMRSKKIVRHNTRNIEEMLNTFGDHD